MFAVFQDKSLGDRIISIASLMIAYVAFIPTIRNEIPPGPKIVFIEGLIYSVAMTSFIAFVQSLLIVNDEKYSSNEWN